jgi:hypothetical protein
MRLTLKIARVLTQLIQGATLPSSSAKSSLIDDLVIENIIWRKGKHKKTLELINEHALHNYLSNQLQINDLKEFIATKENENASRADFVKVTTDSKDSKERTFKGFLVNCYDNIETTLLDQPFVLKPCTGSFVFIYDFENFKIPEDITIVGVENPRNFRHIQEQRDLFKGIKPLFISRYPQHQSKDFIKWMKLLPNPYLHFGDFDLAGISIYLNEYKKHLPSRSTFFIPEDIKNQIKASGNRSRYDIQKQNFTTAQINEPELIAVLKTIHKEKKGLDQEFFI